MYIQQFKDLDKDHNANIWIALIVWLTSLKLAKPITITGEYEVRQKNLNTMKHIEDVSKQYLHSLFVNIVPILGMILYLISTSSLSLERDTILWEFGEILTWLLKTIIVLRNVLS